MPAAAPTVDPGYAAAPATTTETTPTDAGAYNTTILADATQTSTADPFTTPPVDVTAPVTEPVATVDSPAPIVLPETPVMTEAPAPAIETPAAADNGLLSIKQSALQSLTPLLSHLEQSPEEKFRTTMMMIQASDDQSLLQAAYDAANAITDEKTKAQALLDVVNEINYFTQAKAAGQQAQ